MLKDYNGLLNIVNFNLREQLCLHSFLGLQGFFNDKPLFALDMLNNMMLDCFHVSQPVYQM